MSQDLLDAIKNRDDLDEIDYLLNNGADPDYQDEDGMTALHEATLNLDTDRMELLLEREISATVDLEDNDRMTALNHAYMEYEDGNELDILPAINLLLKYGASPIHPDRSGSTLMQWAAFNGYDVIVNRMLEAGVDARSALGDAEEGGYEHTIKLLNDSILESSISMHTETDNDSRPGFFR